MQNSRNKEVSIKEAASRVKEALLLGSEMKDSARNNLKFLKALRTTFVRLFKLCTCIHLIHNFESHVIKS